MELPLKTRVTTLAWKPQKPLSQAPEVCTKGKYTMTFRSMLVGVACLSTLVLAAGCSTEVPGDDEVLATVSADTSAPKNVTYTNADRDVCTGTSTATHKKATDLVRYAFGKPFTFPAGAACVDVKAALDDLKAGLSDGTIGVSTIDAKICGLTTNAYNVFGTGTRLNNIINKLQFKTAACFGPGVLEFLMPLAMTGPGFLGLPGYMFMDPEPATLTADLSSTQGASAAAYYTLSLEPTVAKKWSSTYASCAAGLAAGDACSTTSLSAGQQAEKLIQKTGTSCRCL